jgi:hypothetical protein
MGRQFERYMFKSYEEAVAGSASFSHEDSGTATGTDGVIVRHFQNGFIAAPSRDDGRRRREGERGEGGATSIPPRMSAPLSIEEIACELHSYEVDFPHGTRRLVRDRMV